MRTTKDLIRELDAEKDKFFSVAIAVGFENSTIFVFGCDADRLTALNQALEAGGEAIGLIGLTKDIGKLCGYCKPFEEYANEPWAVKYLGALMKEIGKQIKAKIGIESKAGWLN